MSKVEDYPGPTKDQPEKEAVECIRLVRRMVDNRDDGFRGPQ